MKHCGFHVDPEQSLADCFPEVLVTKVVADVLELLRQRHPGVSIEAWHDEERDGLWQFTVEGWCRVEIRGDRLLLSEPLRTDPEGDDLPAITEWIPIGSLKELGERLP